MDYIVHFYGGGFMNDTLMIVLVAFTIIASVGIAILSIVFMMSEKGSDIYVSERHELPGKALPKKQ